MFPKMRVSLYLKTSSPKLSFPQLLPNPSQTRHLLLLPPQRPSNQSPPFLARSNAGTFLGQQRIPFCAILRSLTSQTSLTWHHGFHGSTRCTVRYVCLARSLFRSDLAIVPLLRAPSAATLWDFSRLLLPNKLRRPPRQLTGQMPQSHLSSLPRPP